MFMVVRRNAHIIAVAVLTLLTILTYVRGAPNLFVAEDFYVIARGSYTLPEMLSASAAAVRVRPHP